MVNRQKILKNFKDGYEKDLLIVGPNPSFF